MAHKGKYSKRQTARLKKKGVKKGSKEAHVEIAEMNHKAMMKKRKMMAK